MKPTVCIETTIPSDLVTRPGNDIMMSVVDEPAVKWLLCSSNLYVWHKM